MQSLHEFLITELKPISDADPYILASYVMALLKNDQVAPDGLKKFCYDQLWEFLGEATESFVAKLFKALEDGIVSILDAELPPESHGEIEEEEEDLFLEDDGAGEVKDDVLADAEPSSDGFINAQDGLAPSEDNGGEKYMGNDNGRTVDKEEREDGEHESSDDDDDRNHKHRRRGGSQFIDRNVEDGGHRTLEEALTEKADERSREDGRHKPPDVKRATGRGMGLQGADLQRGIVRPPYPSREFPGRLDRRDAREPFVNRVGPGPGPVGRFAVGAVQRGVGLGVRQPPFQAERAVPNFDSSMRNVMALGINRGAGLVEGWGRSALPDRRFPSPSFGDGQPPLLGSIAGRPAFFPPGRVPPGPPRGNVGLELRPVRPWGVFGSLGGPSVMDRPPPMAPNMQNVGGDRGPPMAANVQNVGGGIGSRGPPILKQGFIGATPRIRCHDFEERGFCLRGDLCPMDHGADRIVVEDIKHLRQLGLPLATVRPMRPNPIPPNPSLAPATPIMRVRTDKNMALDMVRAPPEPVGVSRVNRDTIMKGEVVRRGEERRAEHKNLDQPLWFKDRVVPKPIPPLGRVPPLKDIQEDVTSEVKVEGSADAPNLQTGLLMRGTKKSGNVSVWERIERPVAAAFGVFAPAGPMSEMEKRGIKRERTDFSRDLLLNSSMVEAGSNDSKGKDPLELPGPRNLQSMEIERPVKKSRDGRDMQGGAGDGIKADVAPTVLKISEKMSRDGRVPLGGRDTSETNGSNKVGGRAGSAGTAGIEREKAQRTLFVKNLPTDVQNVEDALAKHFKKFGSVISVKMANSRDKAYVQFAKKADAEVALVAPEAVIGNRFITLHWAFHDNDPVLHAPPPPRPVHAVQPVPNRKYESPLANGSLSGGSHGSKETAVSLGNTENAGNRGNTGDRGDGGSSSNGNPVASVREETLRQTPPPPTAGLAQSTAVPIVKQKEKLELLKEIQRKKEALLVAQIEQQRKMLAKLGKQKPQLSTLDNHGSKDGASSQKEGTPPRKADMANSELSPSTSVEPSKKAQTSSPGGHAEASASVSPQLIRTLSGGNRTNQKAAAGAGGPIRATQPAAHMHSSPYYSPWGSARYKLDNRSTALRVLPPIPAVALEPGAIWSHFSAFAEVSSVETKPPEISADSISEASSVGTSDRTVRVVFANRAGAEWAMAQGKWMAGVQLHLAWGPPATKKKEIVSITKPTVSSLADSGGVVASSSKQEAEGKAHTLLSTSGEMANVKEKSDVTQPAEREGRESQATQTLKLEAS